MVDLSGVSNSPYPHPQYFFNVKSYKMFCTAKFKASKTISLRLDTLCIENQSSSPTPIWTCIYFCNNRCTVTFIALIEMHLAIVGMNETSLSMD